MEKFIASILVHMLVFAFLSLMLMLCWNHFLVSNFSALPIITYSQAVAMKLIANLLTDKVSVNQK